MDKLVLIQVFKSDLVFYALFVRGHYSVYYDLCWSGFSAYSFKKLVFRLSVFWVFCQFCFEYDVIFMDFS